MRLLHSTRRRLQLAFACLSILALSFPLASLVLHAGEQNSIEAARLGAQQVQDLNELRQSWLGTAAGIDHLLLTRQPGSGDLLVAQANELTLKLAVFRTQAPGLSEASKAANKVLVQELVTLGDELSDVSSELVAAARASEWERAMQIRQDRLLPSQARLMGLLENLENSLQPEIAAAAAQADTAMNASRIAAIAAVVVFLVFAAFLGSLTINSIARPLDKLREQIDLLAAGDLRPVSPLPPVDELGRLSASLAGATEGLRASQIDLEERIAQRTRSLQRRAVQMQTAAEVAREITTMTGLDSLLDQAVELIQERFEFSHAGLFLVEETGQYAVLQAATGEAGREMLARGHRLKVGETGLVGYAAGRGEPRIALDVGTDSTHFKNPLLPDTRLEIALPLRIGSRITGVLDVQSNDPASYNDSDLEMLQVLADQLAIAIENAHLYEQAQENLRELKAVSAEYGRQAWEAITRTAASGYRFDGIRLSPVVPVPARREDDEAPLKVPLDVRGVRIGWLEVWPAAGQEKREEKELLEAISLRVSQALESARLYEETRSRASREELINQLTGRMARSLDIDTLLRTAVRELGQMPQVVEVSVHVGPPDENSQAGLPGNNQPDAPTAPGGFSGNGRHPREGKPGRREE